MDAYALLLRYVADNLVTIDRVAALGDVCCDRFEAVNDNGVVALGASCSVTACASGRLCGSCGSESLIALGRAGSTGLVRISSVKSVDLCDIIIDYLLGSLRSLCFRALGITGLVSLAKLDRKFVRAVCDVAVCGYTVAKRAALLFGDVSDVVVTET